MTVETLEATRLGERDALELGQLGHAIWPAKDGSPARPEASVTYSGPANRRPRIVVARVDGRIVSKAAFEPREILIGGRRTTTLALGGVCTYPEFRNRGLAAACCRELFALVDRGDFEFSLFQTPVPDFYAKLGCRAVANRIFNSLNEGKPTFWDPFACVYPTATDFGDAEIDSVGPGW